MTQPTLNDVDDRVWTRLREQAATRSLTPEAEAKASLSQALVKQESNPWAAVDAIRERLAASGRSFGDSAELIAEDRSRATREQIMGSGDPTSTSTRLSLRIDNQADSGVEEIFLEIVIACVA